MGSYFTAEDTITTIVDDVATAADCCDLVSAMNTAANPIVAWQHDDSASQCVMQKMRLLQQDAAWGRAPADVAQASCSSQPDLTTFYAENVPVCAAGFNVAIANMSMAQGIDQLLTYTTTGGLTSLAPSLISVANLDDANCATTCRDSVNCVAYTTMYGTCVMAQDALLATAAVLTMDTASWASSSEGEGIVCWREAPLAEPQTCWMWGDPHWIGFDGSEYDAHSLGVRTMAAWGDDSVEVYSCPVLCDSASSADHFPCGASSGVAMAAHVGGHAVMVAGDVVYVDGVETAIAEGETVTDGDLSVSRLPDDDPDYKTPGLKLTISMGDAEVSTWKWDVDRMPTGYLQNVRLSLMPSAYASYPTGACNGAAAAAVAATMSSNAAWISSKLDELASTCAISDRATFTPAASAAEACELSTTSLHEAMLACTNFDTGSSNYEACLFDFCATGGDALVEIQDDLAAAGTADTVCPSYATTVSQGADLRHGVGASHLSDPSMTQVFEGVHTEAACCEIAQRYACSVNPVKVWQVSGSTCIIQRTAFLATAGSSASQFAFSVAGTSVPDGEPSHIFYAENPACRDDAGTAPCAEEQAAAVCTGNSAETCYFDIVCKTGGLGCNAGGHSNCRFCGFGNYAAIACPGTALVTTVMTQVTVPGSCPQACTGNPAEKCYHDADCLDPLSDGYAGGLGCNAGGQGQNCRFCGFGTYSELSCPSYSASVAETHYEVNAALHATTDAGAAAGDVEVYVNTTTTFAVEGDLGADFCTTSCDGFEASLPDPTASVTCACGADPNGRRLSEVQHVTITISQNAASDTSANDAYLNGGGGADAAVAVSAGGKGAAQETERTTVISISAPSDADPDAVQRAVESAVSLSMGLADGQSLTLTTPLFLVSDASPPPPGFPEFSDNVSSDDNELASWAVAIIAVAVTCVFCGLIVIGLWMQKEELQVKKAMGESEKPTLNAEAVKPRNASDDRRASEKGMATSTKEEGLKTEGV